MSQSPTQPIGRIPALIDRIQSCLGMAERRSALCCFLSGLFSHPDHSIVHRMQLRLHTVHTACLGTLVKEIDGLGPKQTIQSESKPRHQFQNSGKISFYRSLFIYIVSKHKSSVPLKAISYLQLTQHGAPHSQAVIDSSRLLLRPVRRERRGENRDPLLLGTGLRPGSMYSLGGLNTVFFFPLMQRMH